MIIRGIIYLHDLVFNICLSDNFILSNLLSDMKKLLLLFVVYMLVFNGFSQENPQAGNSRKSAPNRFFAGISYSYMSVDMELASMKLHSVWKGVDPGIEEKTDDEIAAINGYVDRYSRINAFCIQLGMVFLNKPEVRWKLQGTLFAGLAENLTTVTNTLNSVQEYSFNSGYSKPCLGLGFDLGYQFSPEWGIVLRPFVVGTMGKSNSVEDLANPDLLNFNVKKENNYRTIYGKVSLLAGYTTGKVTVYAGPGFYRIWSHHEYKREYTQTEDWETITEEMTTTLVPVNFMDGNLAALWKISDRFSMNLIFGFGNDVNVNAGLHYNF